MLLLDVFKGDAYLGMQPSSSVLASGLVRQSIDVGDRISDIVTLTLCSSWVLYEYGIWCFTDFAE